VRARLVAKGKKTVEITAGGKKTNKQFTVADMTKRSLNPNNKLHSMNETILETAMTRRMW
jgi:hypothetical protein